jgi:outer membrane PBP1 activator LpoA protein
MRSSFNYIQHLVLLVCVGLLANCTTITENHPHQSHPITSPYTMPASAYLALANKQEGNEQQTLLLMAAGRFIQDGEWQQSRAILTQINPLSVEAADEKKILLAKINLMRAEHRAVLTVLATVQSVNQLPTYYQAQYHDLLAQTYQSLGNLAESVAERIKLERLLPDDLSRSNNKRALWLSLTNLPTEELDTLTLESPKGSILQGWMKLANISRKYNNRPQMMLTQLEQWQYEYPNHPGITLLPESLEEMRSRLYPPPKQIALLLPLTGILAGPGLAIKEGFLAAYEASGASQFTKVKFYDTNIMTVATLYEQAYAEGAEYIIGPLTKNDSSIIASLPHPVPTLLLNDVHSPLNSNAYQFGLSPTLEARQVAARARKNGLSRALIITPSGAWGDEVSRAFVDQWGASGGQIIDTLHYQPEGNLNQSIRGLLHIDASETRARQIKQLLGRSIEATPRRRQDFDMIFLVAYPSSARQIKPLLNYYYAGDMPIYATSSVYAGSINTMKDRDLNGIIFSDIPWVFTHNLGNQNWPEQLNSYNRLYALGMDSFALSTGLNQLLLFPAINSHDGVLYLGPNHQISRILTFGQFRQGTPELVTQD